MVNNTIKIIDTTNNLIKYSNMDYFIMRYYKDKDIQANKDIQTNKANKDNQDNKDNKDNQDNKANKDNQDNKFINLLDYTNNTFWNLSDSWIKVKNYLEYLEL
jgi:hypothetical protein